MFWYGIYYRIVIGDGGFFLNINNIYRYEMDYGNVLFFIK